MGGPFSFPEAECPVLPTGGIGERRSDRIGGDPEHDLVTTLLRTRSRSWDLGRDQRGDVIDISCTDRNDDLDPVRSHDA